MQPSIFNVRVPLPERGEVFLMNTLTDAQIVVPEPVVALLDSLGAQADDAPKATRTFDAEEREALRTLAELGFVVEDHDSDRRAVDAYFHDIRESQDQLRLTVLTTLQCNFACDYCFQGDHGDYNKTAHKMTLETAERVAQFAEERLAVLRPKSFALTFFGGEPLLNLPVVYFLAARLHAAATERGVTFLVNIITNGLLLTREVVTRLKPLGLNGVKITLDGDQAMHDRMRPLRGGQGTFDRIIANIRAIAGECRIAIGGNFDAESAETYPALLDFLASEPFAPAIAKVVFKPVIRAPRPDAAPSLGGRRGAIIPLTPVAADGHALGGTCMTAAGSGSAGKASSPCDSCHFVDDTMSFLREETKKRGFDTVDGVHMGPCEIHRRHAHTIGPDGALYACPGFTGDAAHSTGHVDGRTPSVPQVQASARFDRLAAWKQCGDCSYIPVCAGGCSVASHTELGDMNTPTCHRSSFDSALVSFAADAARTL